MSTDRSFPSFQSRIIPVVALDDAHQAVPLARALLAGGIDVIEVTLRTPAGLAGISMLRDQVPDIVVAAGSILRVADLEAACAAGAMAIFSPGATTELLSAGQGAKVPFVPGIATPSELMTAMGFGYPLVKFFPAESLGGVKMLAALAGPLPNARFCPTGGINRDNLNDYLRLPQVAFVGGTWIASSALIREKNWKEVSRLSQEATDLAALAR